MKAVINLTTQELSQEQRENGYFSLGCVHAINLKSLLNFTHEPTEQDIKETAYTVARLAFPYCVEVAMIGCDNKALQNAIAEELEKHNIKAVYC